jgi:voltage-gated potassium channel
MAFPGERVTNEPGLANICALVAWVAQALGARLMTTPAPTVSLSIPQRLASYFRDGNSNNPNQPGSRGAIVVDLLITGLVLASLAIFVAETYTLPPQISTWLERLNNGILVIFAIEYGLRLWAAPQKLRYVFSLYALIDLLTIVPFFIGLTNISFIRIFRWFRILRLLRFLKEKSLFGLINTTDGVLFIQILFTLLAIIFVYSGLIYQTEHEANPGQFRTFLDAFYFAVVTMTTVGFGDVIPVSDLGRLLTILMIFTGIGLIPWQLGDLVRQLVKTGNQQQNPCLTCGLVFHDRDAQFCKSCGSWLTPLQFAAMKRSETSPDNLKK